MFPSATTLDLPRTIYNTIAPLLLSKPLTHYTVQTAAEGALSLRCFRNANKMNDVNNVLNGGLVTMVMMMIPVGPLTDFLFARLRMIRMMVVRLLVE